MIRLLFIVAFVGISISAQQTVYGKITDEEQHPIPATLVMNMKTGFQAYSDVYKRQLKYCKFLRFWRNFFVSLAESEEFNLHCRK